MNKQELVKLVKQIIDFGDRTEKEVDKMISILEQNVPHPAVTDLIYYNELSPEEIVDNALSYKPTRI